MPTSIQPHNWPILARMPAPAKALATVVIVILSIAMAGALAQIIVHDIIPTFFAAGERHGNDMPAASPAAAPQNTAARGDLFNDTPAAPRHGASSESQRGDLLGELPAAGNDRPGMLMDNKQLVWLLKWTHIHLFGMSMIFLFMGAVTVFLDTSAKTRVWLVVLPFVGILVDINAMWLKTYVSPAFFWLHIPGGGLFGVVFAWVSVSALAQMWLPHTRRRSTGTGETAP